MADTKHTPGPWVAFKYTEPANRSTGLAVGWHINQGDGQAGYVTTVHMMSHRAEECEANARLIASAPCLLAALQLIVTWNRDHATDQYGDPNRAESWACVKAARAAIAKATGADHV